MRIPTHFPKTNSDKGKMLIDLQTYDFERCIREEKDKDFFIILAKRRK